MFRKLAVVCLSAFVLAGCASKGIDVSHFGGQESADKAFSKSETPILIGDYGNSRPNSAGGVNVTAEVLNTSDKTIKYITFWFTPYNRVGDRTSDDLGRGSTRSARYMGPLEPWETNTFKPSFGIPKVRRRWENFWYNSNIHCVTIDKVRVIYMDDEEIEIKDVDDLLTREEKCRSYN